MRNLLKSLATGNIISHGEVECKYFFCSERSGEAKRLFQIEKSANFIGQDFSTDFPRIHPLLIQIRGGLLRG